MGQPSELSFTNFFASLGHVARGVAGVDHQRGVANDKVVIEQGVVGGYEHTILAGEKFGGEGLAGHGG